MNMRDHGGNLDAAIVEFGGAPTDWLDLSTGINPHPYRLPPLSASAWDTLPTKTAQRALVEAAQTAFKTNWDCLPVAGAQAGIQMLPRLLARGAAKVLWPTYNEHAASLKAAGWSVENVHRFDDLAGADLAVVVNPNNPTGEIFAPADLLKLSNSVGYLIIDESFCDPHPDASILQLSQKSNVIVLRSFGKFFGLAGLRLGFVLGASDLIATLREFSGPWPVSGPAIEIGCKALADTVWQAETSDRLATDAARMDDLAVSGGWTVLGGTTLFRLYDVGSALETQRALATHHIWSRVFPYSDAWIRLGLPHGRSRWTQLETTLAR